MDPKAKNHMRYFSILKKSLPVVNELKNPVSGLFKSFPGQYSYVHNLVTGKLERVNGVERVLGFEDYSFSLEKYYSLLHPDDKPLVFEATRNGFKFLEKNTDPFSVQLNITYRILNSNDCYLHLLRQTAVYEIADSIITKTISHCLDISWLHLRPFASVDIFTLDTCTKGQVRLVNRSVLGEQLGLTYREKEVIMLIGEGCKNKEIARRLNISEHTVATHRKNILKKTGKDNFNKVLLLCKENELF